MHRLSIYTKLTIAYLIGGIILAGFGWFQVQSAQQFQLIFSDFTGSDLRRIIVLDELQTAQLKAKTVLSEQKLDALRGRPVAAQAAAMRKTAQKMRDHLAVYQLLVRDDRKSIPEATVNRMSDSVDVLTDVMVGVSKETTRAGIEKAGARFSSASKGVDLTMSALAVAEHESIRLESERTAIATSRLSGVAIILSGTGVVMSLVMVFLLSLWISRPMKRLKNGAEQLANGDLSQKLDESTNDVFGELGHSFNEMAGRMRESYRRLALRQQLDESMLRSMGEGIIAFDENAEVILVNKVTLGFIGGVSEKDIIGKNYMKLFDLYPETGPSKDKPIPMKKRLAYLALHKGQAGSGIFRFKRGEKDIHLINAVVNPIKLNGKIVGAVVVLRDVTKEREVDRMKTEFISLASHQLRTPLSAIKWFSEMLLAGDAGKLKPEQEDYMRNISSSTERMIDLVNALLNISRIESGRIMIAPEPTDLRELVTGIVNDLKAKTEDKRQQLIISVNDQLPKINLDPRLISQVYMNLLSNAIKYTQKEGEITVFVSRKGDEVISQITDNGYGIPKAQQRRMFEKFFRAANVSKIVTDGTGLGLYLTKAVVESSGGRIWFESEEGKGTTFWFSVPIKGMKAKKGEVTLDG